MVTKMRTCELVSGDNRLFEELEGCNKSWIGVIVKTS